LGGEEYVDCCNRRNTMAWLKVGVRKLRGVGKGSCPLSLCMEHVKHIFELPCNQKMVNAIYCKRWFSMNGEIVYRNISNRSNKARVRNLGRYLVKVKCKWQNKVKEM
jgi:hypothetical protein